MLIMTTYLTAGCGVAVGGLVVVGSGVGVEVGLAMLMAAAVAAGSGVSENLGLIAVLSTR